MGGDAGCDGAFDIGCTIASAASNAIVEMLRAAAEWVVQTAFAWWINVDPIDLAGTSAVSEIRGYLFPLALAVAVGGVMWQGIRMALSRKPTPAVDLLTGLGKFAFFSAAGVLIFDRALTASDQFANFIMDRATGGAGAERLVDWLSLTGLLPGVVMILALVIMVAGLLQAMVMMLREASLVILTGVVIFAAAGSIGGTATKGWLPKVLSWALALLAYKPVAALVYAAGFALAGEAGEPGDARTTMVGVMMLVLSLFALPALMKFFTWAIPGGMGSGGGGASLAMVGAAGAAAHYGRSGAMAAGGSAAAGQARQVRQDLGPVAGRPAAAGAGGAAGRAGAAGAAGMARAGASTTTAVPVMAGATAGSGGAGAAGAGGAAATAGTAGAAGAGGAAGGPAGAATVVVAQGAKRAADGAATQMTSEPQGDGR